MAKRFSIFLFFISILFYENASAISIETLEQQWKWANFDEKNGLIRSAFNSVYQAKNGVIWTVSDNGIFYYDHFKWNRVKAFNATDRFSNPGIIDEDSKGNLYTCFYDTLFIISEQNVRKILFSINQENILIEQAFFKSDSVYIKYRIKNENFFRLGLVVNGKISSFWSGEKYPITPYTTLFKTKAGNIYFSINEKIFKIQNNQVKYLCSVSSEKCKISQISENKKGDGFVAYASIPSDFKIHRFNFNLSNTTKKVLLQSTNFPRSLDIFNDGNILILNRQGNTSILDKNNQFHEWLKPSNVGSRNFVFIDENESIWMGSFGKLHWFQTNSKYWSFRKFKYKGNNNDCKSLFMDKDSNIWTSLMAGLVKIDKYGNETFIESANGQKIREITTINQDENGKIWIGSGAVKNMTFSFDGKTWTHHNSNNGLTNQCIHKIEKGIDGKLYFLVFINKGFLNGDGEGIYILDRGKFLKPNWVKKLKQKRFYSFLQQKDSSIWLVGLGYIVKIKNDSIYEFQVKNGLPNNNIYDLTEDTTGKIWFFAIPKGLHYIENKKVNYIDNQQDQDSKRSVAEILIDNKGIIWYTGSEGVYAYSNYSHFHIDQKVGLQSQTAWPIIQLKNKLYIGTNGEGINTLDLSILDIPAPEVILSPIQVEGKEAGFVWKAFTYDQSYPDDYSLSYSVNGGPWSVWSTEQQVIVQGLKFGENKLEYRVKGIFPNNNMTVYESSIKVPYPYYAQINFILPILLLLFALLFLSIKYLINNKKNISGLINKEKRMESYIRSMPFNSAILNEQGICLESFFTYNSRGQEFSIQVNQSLPQMFNPQKSLEIKQAIERCIHLQFYETKEFTFQNKNGETKHYEIRISPFEESSEKTNKTLVVFIDVTESKLNQEELLKAKQIAEKANQTKMQFLSNMSHEIRTPMNAIIGITDMMFDDIEEPVQKENLSLIKRSADNLLVIINDILDISKIESGKVEIEYIDFNLIELIEQLIGTFKFKAAKKGIKFHHSFQRNTPEYLHGDPVRLNQILVNLIGNAIKFTEKGEVKLEILIIEIVKNQVRLKFKVIDTGIGIAAESQSKIFESFAQEGRTITRRFGGTGLGLSISKHLAELLNGTIELESEQGKGSIFTVILPFKLALKLNKLEYISQENRNLQNIKILLVEDNNMNQIVANQLLKKWNAQVKCVFNGIEALEILQKEEFDLILMDLQMPEMDGYEATKNIRKQKKWNKIPIIALTADAFPEIKKQALETGMDEFISKPFNQDELYFKISKLVFNH
jgi:signal transduction histidine kinase/CheY-like chemotaxis protein/streptogramin lyase